MNGEFKKYICENKEIETEDIAGQLRYLFRGDLFNGHEIIDNISVDERAPSHISIRFKKPLITLKVFSKNESMRSVYVNNHMTKITYGFGTTPFLFEKSIDKIKLGRKPGTVKEISKGELALVLYEEITKMIKDPESFIVQNEPKQIAYIINPSKEIQKKVLDQDPKNITYINNPDPEFVKKYGYIKSMSRAGIV